MGRLKTYFNGVADLLELGGKMSAVVGHLPDIGSNREKFLFDFLQGHAPRRLRATLGGRVIGLTGAESKQVDILLTHDLGTSLQELLRQPVPVEMLAMAVSVKSKLSKAELIDALSNLASIPAISPEVLTTSNPDFFARDHPSLVIFAYDGLALDSCLKDLNEFNAGHPEIPENRRPKMIIVNKRYAILQHPYGYQTLEGRENPPGAPYGVDCTDERRGWPLTQLLTMLISYTTWLGSMSPHIHKYTDSEYGIFLRKT